MTADGTTAEPGGRGVWWRWLPRSSRTWRLTVPLHLAAFLVLYLASFQLMQSEVVGGSTRMARERLRDEILELLMLIQAHPAVDGGGHRFDAFMAIPRPYGSQLYTTNGTRLAGAETLFTPTARQIADFLGRDRPDTYHVASVGDRKFVNGLSRIAATQRCVPCHQPGEVLAVATMNLDVTAQLGTLRGRLLRNLALLIVSWAAALGIINVAVKRAARHAADELEEDLAAAASGEPAARRPAAALGLDPVTAELHRSLRAFLERHRQRQSELTERLAHTDQLASLGRLAAGLAHEIKNPLAGIQGVLEILRQDSDDEDTSRLYEEMLGELERVNGTLQLLLSSARPSPPQLTDVDLRTLLQEIRTLLEPSLRRQGTRLRLEIAGGGLRARIDPGKIRQVLVNLIHNAGEALGEGGTITLRAGPLADREGVILAVEDTGPGIPEEQQRQIFEPFFTTKFAGTGLGLAIARSLVEQHGGLLQVESTSGHTTFLILLPGSEPSSQPVAESLSAG